MKMLSKPEGISKMMKAVQGLTGGMGGGGGPLFGGGQNLQAQGGQAGQMGMPPFGLDPNNMPSNEEMQKQMAEMQKNMPPEFKKKFNTKF